MSKQERLRRQWKRRLRREAKYFWRLIEDKAARLGVEHWAWERDMSGKGVSRYRQRLQFLQCRMTPEAFYWQIDMTRLPHGVSTKMLRDPDFARDLSVTCRREVRYKESTPKGAWLVMWRDEARAGVPSWVKYNQVLPLIPESASPTAFVIGVSENRRAEVQDLDRMPHLLIGGSTDSGKSVFLNSVLCTIMLRATPQQVRFFMIDLKGGVELSFYEGIPHLADEITTEPKDVIPRLAAFHEEILRRQALLKGKVRDIHGWNRMHPAQAEPLLILVIDEWAEISQDKRVANHKGEAEQLLSRCAALGRASGCYLVVATQRPDSTVLTGLVKQNLPARVAFACDSVHSSRTIINNGDAFRLHPRGRFIFMRGNVRFEAQGPYLSDVMVKKIVHHVIGDKSKRPDERNWQTILRYARDNLGGELSRRALYDGLHGTGISELDIRRLINNVGGKVIGLDGQAWRIARPQSGRVTRMELATGPVDVPEDLPARNGEGDVAPAETDGGRATPEVAVEDRPAGNGNAGRGQLESPQAARGPGQPAAAPETPVVEADLVTSSDVAVEAEDLETDEWFDWVQDLTHQNGGNGSDPAEDGEAISEVDYAG